MEYLLKNNIHYVANTLSTCAVYINDEFKTFTADMVTVPDQYYKFYRISGIDTQESALSTVLHTFTVNHYIDKCYYTIRPTLFCDDFTEISDNTTMSITVDFYDNDGLYYSDKHVYPMNKQNTNTINVMNILNLKHYITKIIVTIMSDVPTRTTTLRINHAKNSNKRFIGEVLLL